MRKLGIDILETSCGSSPFFASTFKNYLCSDSRDGTLRILLSPN
jgi:hypothetical protein